MTQTPPVSPDFAAMARCPKPGCGALKAAPCTDGDCPQQWVRYSEHAQALTLSHAAGRAEGLAEAASYIEANVRGRDGKVMAASIRALASDPVAGDQAPAPAPGLAAQEVEQAEFPDPAPWCKDALFLVATHGDGKGAQLVRGWTALCETIVDVHYFEPDGLQREEVLARVTAWDDWQNDDTGPYFLALDYEDGSVTITRVTAALSAPRPAQAKESAPPSPRTPEGQ